MRHVLSHEFSSILLSKSKVFYLLKERQNCVTILMKPLLMIIEKNFIVKFLK